MLTKLLRRWSLWRKGRIIFLDELGYKHCVNGPAVEFKDGYKAWYRHGIFHREDGPAIIDPEDGNFWYVNGQQHREDGPAIEYHDGRQEWWYRGISVRSLMDIAWLSDRRRREEHASRYL